MSTKKDLPLALLWLRAVFSEDCDLPASTKAVVGAIWRSMNAEGGRAFPGLAAIGKRAGGKSKAIKDRQVKNHLRAARKAGWLETTQAKSKGGVWKNNTYVPRFPDGYDRGHSVAPGDDLNGGQPEGNGVHHRGQPAAPGDDNNRGQLEASTGGNFRYPPGAMDCPLGIPSEGFHVEGISPQPLSSANGHGRGRFFEKNGSIDGRKQHRAVHPGDVSERALNRVREIAPGWDRQWLLNEWVTWNRRCGVTPDNCDAAFLAWVRKFTKGRPPGEAA
jgi:hypothetical protein